MPKVFLSPSNQYDNRYAYGDTTEGVQCGKIAEACKAALERSGVTVKLMHEGTMRSKIAAANSWGADLYVCIHTNAANGQVSGTRIFCYDKSSKGYQAAQKVFAVLAPLTPGESENISVADYTEIVGPAAPTVYVECEFHDVPSVAQWIVEHTEDIGRAIAQGVCDYFGVAEQPQTPAEAPAESNTGENEEVIEMELRMLKRGMEGNDVRAAMLLMQDKGYYPGEIWSGDKLFGPKMEAGLRRMQADHGLGVDGILGSNSWNFLLK